MIKKGSDIDKAPIKPVRFYPDKRLEKEMRGISDNDYVSVKKRIKRNFWKHSPFGRTLSLRNKTGKTIGGVVLSIVGSYTGIKLDIIPKQTIDPMLLLLQELAFLNDPIILVVTVALALLAIGTGYLIHKGYITEAMGTEIKSLLSSIKDARQPDSPGGKEFTSEERAKILAE